MLLQLEDLPDEEVANLQEEFAIELKALFQKYEDRVMGRAKGEKIGTVVKTKKGAYVKKSKGWVKL